MIIYTPNHFFNRILKPSTDTHHLANALHATTGQPGQRHVTKFLEVPARRIRGPVQRTRHFRDRVLTLLSGIPRPRPSFTAGKLERSVSEKGFLRGLRTNLALVYSGYSATS